MGNEDKTTYKSVLAFAVLGGLGWPLLNPPNDLSYSEIGLVYGTPLFLVSLVFLLVALKTKHKIFEDEFFSVLIGGFLPVCFVSGLLMLSGLASI